MQKMAIMKASGTRITMLDTNIVEPGRAKNIPPEMIKKLQTEVSVFIPKQSQDR